MTQSIFYRFWFLSIPLLVGVVVAVTWANYRFAEQYPGGADFRLQWAATRALLVDGETPYSDAVANQVQGEVYGRPARPGEVEFRVVSPLYFVIVYLPYALISDFNLARAAWMTTLELALLGLAFLALRLTRWKLGVWTLLFYLLFAVFWYYSILPLVAGDVVILIAFWIALAFLALRSGRDEVAGILLAFTTIKPDLILFILVFAMVWTLSARRWAALFWTIAAVAILSFIMGFFIPDWPVQNLREIMRAAASQPPGTPAAVFSTMAPAAGRWIGLALSALVWLLLLIEWFVARGKEFRWFLWTACLTLVASQWGGIQTGPENFILLFLPLVLVFAALEKRWGKAGRVMNWFFMLVMLLVPWYFLLDSTLSADQPQPAQWQLFLLPIFLLVTLYWVRWWAVLPRRFFIDALRESEALE